MSSRLTMMPAPAHQGPATETSMLWFTREGADVVICCSDGIELQAHQTIISRSLWFACTFADLQLQKSTEVKYLQIEERASIMRPLLAFCYGVKHPLLKKGPKSEAHMRNLVDLYHVNDCKFHVPELAAACEAALANLDDDAESPGHIGEKSPMHGVVSRMLSTEIEDCAEHSQNIYRMGDPGRLLFSTRHSASDKDEKHHRNIANLHASQTSTFSSVDLYQRTLGEQQERHGRKASSEVSSARQVRGSDTFDPHSIAELPGTNHERRGIPIPGVPTMTRLRDRSPGGTPYSSSRLYYEILSILGPLGMPSLMLSPEFNPPLGSFSPESPGSPSRWSMSPSLQDRMTPPEDTVHLIPEPLRPLKKEKTSSSGLFGPRPLPPGHGSKSSITLQETATKTLVERSSNATLKEGIFSSLRGATRRAFHGGRSKY